MIEKLKPIYKKYKEFILYAVFGVFTTLANLFTYLGTTALLGEKYVLVNNALAWIAGVVVAFVTNKLYVFNSKSWKLKTALKEFVEFVGARFFSFAFEELGMLFFVSVFHFSEKSIEIFFFTIPGHFIAKVILSVFVVIFNYVFSKFVIFKKNKKDKETPEQ